MPNLYLNDETGTCSNLEGAKKCIVRTSKTLSHLEGHIETLFQHEQRTLKSLNLFSDGNLPQYYESVLSGCKDKERDSLVYLLSKFGTARPYSEIPKGSWLIEELGLPSDIVEYTAVQKAMLLTIATDEIWEKNFITFVDRTERVPNIWGQEDISDLLSWIRESAEESNKLFQLLKEQYNIIFCDKNIEKKLNTSELEDVYEAIEDASKSDFQPNGNSVKCWDGTLYYIRRGNHSSNTIRIFYEKYNEQLLVGGFYRKTTAEIKPERTAAKQAAKKIKDYKKTFDLSDT